MSKQLDLYDVTIIGGGPAGMYAAFYSGMRDLKTKLIEAKEELGGRMLIYPEKMIWDVGGVTPILCEKLIAQLIEQAKTFDPTIVLGEHIVGLEKQEDGTYILEAASVTVVHRRDVFGGHERNVQRMKDSSVDVRTPFAVEQLHSTNKETIETVTIRHMESEESEQLEVDAVIVNHGLKADFSGINEWGLDMDEWNVFVNARLVSNLPGIFAAGDFAQYDSKITLIAGAFTDAALAVNSAKLYMDPEAAQMAYVSSHNERFKEKNRALGVIDEE